MQAQAPKTEQFTLTHSVAAMKNTVRILVSTIAYLRDLFPDETFKPAEYCGLQLMVMRPGKTGQCGAAQQLADFIEKGVFDALEKRYVERIIFNLHATDPTLPGDSNNVVETYSMAVDYDHDEIAREEERKKKPFQRKDVAGTPHKKRPSREDVMTQTRSMIGKLTVAAKALPPLPGRQMWLTIYLAYNSRVPADYEPPTFVPSSMDEVPTFAADPSCAVAGQTGTGFHQLALKIKFAPPPEPEAAAAAAVAKGAPAGAAGLGAAAAGSCNSNGGAAANGTAAPKTPSSSAASALDLWHKVKDALFADVREAVIKAAEPRGGQWSADDARKVIDAKFKQSEWGRSLTGNVQRDLCDRMLGELARPPRAGEPMSAAAAGVPQQAQTPQQAQHQQSPPRAPLREVRTKPPPAFNDDTSSQDSAATIDPDFSEGSLTANRENARKVSRTKRPLELDLTPRSADKQAILLRAQFEPKKQRTYRGAKAGTSGAKASESY